VLDAVHRLFNNPALRKLLVKSRVLLGALVVAAIVWKMDPHWLLPGFLVSMFGEAIQLWCFASLDKGRTLAFNGPYALVRNPMYLGRYFILLGGIMLLGNWWLLAASARRALRGLPAHREPLPAGRTEARQPARVLGLAAAEAQPRHHQPRRDDRVLGDRLGVGPLRDRRLRRRPRGQCTPPRCASAPGANSAVASTASKR
jgi:hypothetical protein